MAAGRATHSHKRTAALLFCTALVTPAFADSVSTSGADGFGRILFTLDPPAHSQVGVSGGVLTIHFDRKVAVDSNAIVQGLSAYVGSARADADGQTFRLALAQEIKPHVSSSANRLAVDLTPAGSSATPPDLSPPAPKEEAVDVTKLPVLPIRAGAYSTYSRLVFDWPRPLNYNMFPSAGHITLRFAGLASPDFAALERIAPPWVKHGGWRVEHGATIIEFTTDPGAKARTSRIGAKVVLDVMSPATDSTASEAAQKQAILAAANQLNGTPKAPTVSAVKPAGNNPQRQTNPSVPAAPAHNAPGTLFGAAPNPPKNIVPAIQPPPKPEVTAARTQDGATLNFPGAKTAAAFVRANVAWIVVEGGPAIDLSKLQAALGDFPASVDGSASGNLTTLRIGLKQPERIAAQMTPDHIAVSIASHAIATPVPLALTRDDDARHPAIASVVPGAAQAFRVTDPVVGDTLIIVPSQPGHAMPVQRNYLEFAALPTASGLVIDPVADDLDVTISQSRVSITRAGGLALTPPTVSIPSSVSALAAAGKSVAFIDFARWRSGPAAGLFASEQKLRARAASAEAREAFQGRLALARFYIANSFGAEALGLVRLMQTNDPALQSEPQLQIIRAAAEYMIGRYRDARADLTSTAFDNDRHAALWRGLTEAALENWPAARDALRTAQAVLKFYPAEWRDNAQIAMVNALMAGGDLEGAGRTLARLPENPSSAVTHDMELARAQLLARTGHAADADALFGEIEASGDEHAAALAVYDRVLCELDSRHITPKVATNELEALRFRWRGDRLELKTLRKLAVLYFARRDWRSGLQMLRQASVQFPEEEQGRAAQDEMRATFERLFLKGEADRMSPVRALGIFYEFIDLTPIGPKGDDMIRRMSDRLIAIDLLSPAAKLLKYQVDNRLDGVARAQVATRLAMLDLLDHKPKEALEALRTTRITGLPDDVTQQRMLLEARALAALKQWEQALDLLAVDESGDSTKLRADIYWESGNWEQAGVKSEELISSAADSPPSLSQADHQNLMRAAIAYSLADDQSALNRLHVRFGAKISGTTDADAFAIVTQKPDLQGIAFKDVAARVASIDTLQAFMTDFRRRYAAK
ncbi:MAG TPA: hypothetical protein VGG69_01265 [Rhizomicrobium sp.]|jgi:hypothetical protein